MQPPVRHRLIGRHVSELLRSVLEGRLYRYSPRRRRRVQSCTARRRWRSTWSTTTTTCPGLSSRATRRRWGRTASLHTTSSPSSWVTRPHIVSSRQQATSWSPFNLPPGCISIYAQFFRFNLVRMGQTGDVTYHLFDDNLTSCLDSWDCVLYY